MEEKIFNLEHSNEDLEIVEIIDESFKQDPLLKFELFKEGVTFTYSNHSSDMESIYISPIRDGHIFLISHMYPYWYDKGLRPYDKITRMVVSNNGGVNEITMFKDRVVKSGEINPETGKPLQISIPTKISGGEKFANEILPRAEIYLNMLLELKRLPTRYNSRLQHFRGNISMCSDCGIYLPIWECIREGRREGFEINSLNFKNMKQSEFPRYNHLPKILFDN